MPVAWSDDLAIGVPAIDQDHQTLIKLINDFEQIAARGRQALYEEAFKKTLTFAKEHFVREERVQRGIGFADHAAHAELHRQFSDQAARLFVRLIGELGGAGRTAVGNDIARFLGDWLIDHIRVQDSRMRPFVEARKPKAAPTVGAPPRPAGSGGSLPDLTPPAAKPAVANGAVEVAPQATPAPRPSSGWPDDGPATPKPASRHGADAWAKEMATPAPVPSAKPTAPAFDLRAVLAAHQEWLTTKGEKGIRAVLGGQPVAGANLAKANLANADLRGADLSDADLSEANLGDADLRQAVLQNVRGQGASFALARLRHADLTRAQLASTVFRGADLSGAIFKEADLSDADFTGATLLDTVLSGAKLGGSNLSNAQMAKIYRSNRDEG